MPCKMIAYYRVSTDKQKVSGLGLDAQRADVLAHVQRDGCDLIAEYTEIETGKKHSLDNRPELKKAIARAKRARAILVVAKLDRLLRSTVVRSLLKTSGVQFVACDNPQANEFMIDILAAVAENEVREISKRTKKALAAKKARGVPLGAALLQCRNLTPKARRRGAQMAAEAHRRNADEAYADVQEWMIIQREGGASFQEIANLLNDDGQTTRRGKPWNPMQVKRVIERAQ